MIKSITVINYLGDALEIGMGSSDESGFLITDITGIGPSKATINSTQMATGDGSFFNSSRVEDRNIVLSITFNPDKNVELLRLKTYQYFSIKKEITLIFKTHSRTCKIKGYVEKNEPNIFSRLEGTQISIICPDPYFYSVDGDSSSTSFSSVVSEFEFPFSNESLEEKLIEFARYDIVDTNTVVYYGDVEVGVTIKIKALNTIGDISIAKLGSDEIMTILSAKLAKITGSPLSFNDELTISTNRNDKWVTLLRGGKFYNVLNCLDKRSAWFKIHRGDNIFTYSADGGELDIQLAIENQTAYEGV